MELEILNDGIIQVKEINNGINYRFVLTPDVDINTITNTELKAKCLEIWTDEVKQSYQERLERESI